MTCHAFTCTCKYCYACTSPVQVVKIAVGFCPPLDDKLLTPWPSRVIGDVTRVSCVTGFVFASGHSSLTVGCGDGDVGAWNATSDEMQCISNAQHPHLNYLLHNQSRSLRTALFQWPSTQATVSSTPLNSRTTLAWSWRLSRRTATS